MRPNVFHELSLVSDLLVPLEKVMSWDIFFNAGLCKIMTPFQRSKGDRPWGKHYGVISAERSEDLSSKTTWWQHYFLPAGVFHPQGLRVLGEEQPEWTGTSRKLASSLVWKDLRKHSLTWKRHNGGVGQTAILLVVSIMLKYIICNMYLICTAVRARFSIFLYLFYHDCYCIDSSMLI